MCIFTSCVKLHFNIKLVEIRFFIRSIPSTLKWHILSLLLSYMFLVCNIKSFFSFPLDYNYSNPDSLSLSSQFIAVLVSY